jgi:hypothetical protein
VKKKNLTRKLIITSILWLVLICVAVGAYIWLDDDIVYLTDATTQEKGQLIVKKQELESIAKNIKNSQLAIIRFVDFAKSDDNKKDFFRKNAVTRSLGDITRELRAVQIKLSPPSLFQEYPNLPSTEKVRVLYSQVKIEYEALTDITAFKILKLISEKLNGTVYYKKFTIEKISDIDSEVLLKISEGNFPSLVRGTIEFDWISIRLKDGVKVEIPELPTQDEPELKSAPTAPSVNVPPAAQTAPAAPQATPQNLPAGGQDV